LHTFACWLRDVTTYIGIESPEKECGKSTLVTVLSKFVNRPVVSSNISSSAFYRVIEELKPTLLIDEADTNLRGKDDLRGILNSGYTKPTAFVWRICYDAAGPEDEECKGGVSSTPGRVARYSCWCPKAIATIGPLHPTLASRCIVVRMQRKMGEEECERLKRLDATELQRKCARFVADHAVEIGKAEPQIPKGLTNRAADVWEPLLALADLAGGQWPALAREAALGLTVRAQGHSPIGSLLLDIYLVFILTKRDRVFSRELVGTLQQSGDRPWLELRRGKQITETWVAQRLRPYGIKSRTIRIGEEVSRGYLREEMMETFKRYIPKSEVEALNADLAERTVKEGETQCDAEAKGQPAVPAPGQADTGEGSAAATGEVKA
jgi:putative DNA primase/helicase